MTVDRIDVNTPDNWSGPAFALGAIDEIVRTQATVHLEAMSDNAAFLAIAKGGEEVRVWLQGLFQDRCFRPDTPGWVPAGWAL